MSFVRQLAVSASRLAVGRHGQMLRGQEVWRRPRFLAGLTASPQPLIVSVRNRPVCQVTTNLTDEQVSKDFLKGLSKVIADTLVKPEQSISISVSTNVRVCRSGSEDPSIIIDIWSIGVFDAQRNKKYAKDIFKYAARELKTIPEDRITLLFHPLQPEDAGHLLYKSSK